ncbi:uncharacterized protein LOC112538719 [Tetranychus urticae]|uniref:uncharacterized protein LOC112538719 n=1 Tax=Tetranychus urticae TaxID=32264 RepID=UPI000D64B56E|nr:uncharacterized protein LOC112538719 [Tetranychus urticae]
MEFLELEPSFDPSLLEPPSTPGHWFGGSLSEEEEEVPPSPAVKSPRGPIILTGGGLKFNFNPPKAIPVAPVGPTPSPSIVTGPIRPSGPRDNSIRPLGGVLPASTTTSVTPAVPLTKSQKKRLCYKRNLKQKRLESESSGTISLAVEHNVLKEKRKVEKRAIKAFHTGIKEAAKATESENVVPASFFHSSENHQYFKDNLPSRILSRESLSIAENRANRALKFNSIVSDFAPNPQPTVNNPSDYLHHLVFHK